MYAVLETGSKQYRVSKGEILEVELLGRLKEGKEVKLGNVLFVSDKKDISIGKPYIKGASVVCEVIGQKSADKVISFKYRRRHASSKRKVGHRQKYTVLKVKNIATSG